MTDSHYTNGWRLGRRYGLIRAADEVAAYRKRHEAPPLASFGSSVPHMLRMLENRLRLIAAGEDPNSRCPHTSGRGVPKAECSVCAGADQPALGNGGDLDER